MIIGVPKEIYPGERRVALVPVVLPTLTKAGFEVHVQAGAGLEAGYPDSAYTEKGSEDYWRSQVDLRRLRHRRAGAVLWR